MGGIKMSKVLKVAQVGCGKMSEYTKEKHL